MFILRCTRRLLERLDASPRSEADTPGSTTLLGDWTATLVIVRRQQLVLAANNSTLLPVVLVAAPYRTLLSRFPDTVGQVLARLDVELERIAVEVETMKDGVVSRTNDRQVLGSLNDFARMLDIELEGRSLVDAAFRLSEAPCSPLKMESPCDVTRRRFARPVLRLVKA